MHLRLKLNENQEIELPTYIEEKILEGDFVALIIDLKDNYTSEIIVSPIFQKQDFRKICFTIFNATKSHPFKVMQEKLSYVLKEHALKVILGNHVLTTETGERIEYTVRKES